MYVRACVCICVLKDDLYNTYRNDATLKLPAPQSNSRSVHFPLHYHMLLLVECIISTHCQLLLKTHCKSIASNAGTIAVCIINRMRGGVLSGNSHTASVLHYTSCVCLTHDDIGRAVCAICWLYFALMRYIGVMKCIMFLMFFFFFFFGHSSCF